jgi:hypothetical protein
MIRKYMKVKSMSYPYAKFISGLKDSVRWSFESKEIHAFFDTEPVPVLYNGNRVKGYWINKEGQICSLVKSFTYLNGKAKMLTPCVTGNSTYPKVGIRIDGKGKKPFVHRLVCESFIPYPKCYPGICNADWKKTPDSVKNILMRNLEVNHKNGVHTDFNLENLEWVTPQENKNHYNTFLRAA